jgi:hypothetical protein
LPAARMLGSSLQPELACGQLGQMHNHIIRTAGSVSEAGNA